MIRGVAPATLPPPGLPGLDPRWSRLVTTPELDGTGRTWHVLDTAPDAPRLTVLCVHGNPSWSYMWRDVLDAAPSDVRVVAVDQLDMGFSERTGTTRRLGRRIDDLDALVDVLGIDSPIVTLAHDWGGAISLGWAVRNVDRLAGVVLTNTAVHQPEKSPAPTLIRLARLPGVLGFVTERTPIFLNGALSATRSDVDPAVRDAFRSPYTSRDRRTAIRHFVADIPLTADHPSFDTLDTIARRLRVLADTPVLMLWGPHDPVFSDLYLRDLHARLPHGEIHRYEQAGHFVTEDADVAGAALAWVERLGAPPEPTGVAEPRRPVWAGLDDRVDDDDVAVVEMAPGGGRTSLSFAELGADVRRIGGGLLDLGVRAGDRVALLVPPGLDLTAVLYACWRVGAVVVVVDAGLGPRGIGRALRSAAPEYIVGIAKALAAARGLGWPGRRIAVDGSALGWALGEVTLDEIRRRGEAVALGSEPDADAPAAVAFTSGSTGPAKGVAYRHHQLQAQRDALAALYGIDRTDRLVAAFAPFALYGPALGIPSVVPAMDATAPGTLTAAALGDAAVALDATLVFASPAAFVNVLATLPDASPAHRAAFARVRLVMSAGAPIAPSLLRRLREVFPNAELHTPYGMTEVLPVADITLDEIEAAGEGDGVCVGYPVPGVDVAIVPLGDEAGTPTTEPNVVGEVAIRAPHMRDGYDKLWVTEAAADRPEGWHRSGDVGRFDAAGRLWIEGRIAHLIHTAAGPLTPVAVEHAAETLPEITRAAAVGVGPHGTQQVVIVAATSPPRRPGLAPVELAAAVRGATGADAAAVLTVPSIPTDRRHNSKIERGRIARWADRVLAGDGFPRL